MAKRSSVTISAAASDNVGVSRIEFYVENKLISKDTASPYSTTWKVPTGKSKIFTIVAKAYDAAGNSNTSTITVRSS